MIRRLSTAVCVLMASVCLSGVAGAAPLADYSDADEIDAWILAQDGLLGGRVTVHKIGKAFHGTKIRAIRVAALDGSGEQLADDATKPALMITCGLHGREWAGPEACMQFVDQLKEWYVWDLLNLGKYGIAATIDEVDLWVIPLVNPDGREQDDAHGGNPLSYGSNSGWRKNTQPVSCELPWPLNYTLSTIGIDLNRNFSAGFSPNDCCWEPTYPGSYPFEAKEARVLRRFVNNRMISMALDVHSWGATVGMINRASGNIASIEAGFRDQWNDASPSSWLDLGLGAKGGGLGQLPGWLAGTSNTAGESDNGTRRGINTVLLELPPGEGHYDDPSYPYRWLPFDSSNEFHPSAQWFIDDLADPVWSAFFYLYYQTRYPWRPVDPNTGVPMVSSACLKSSAACIDDAGLTGSKIAVADDAVGALGGINTAADPRETLPSGSYGVVYRVQNYSETIWPSDIEVEVKIARKTFSASGFTNKKTFTKSFKLWPLKSGTGSVADTSYTYASGYDYKVTVRISQGAGSVSQNDQHVFRFRVK